MSCHAWDAGAATVLAHHSPATLRYDPPMPPEEHLVTDHGTETDGTDEDQRVGALRGAGVTPVNARRLGQVLLGACLVALLVS